MRNLTFEPTFDYPVEKIWAIFSDVGNYPTYIKFCFKAELRGQFAEGSSWYDWSTVAYLPLKITHQIIKVQPEKEIVYKINLPTKGELWQKFNFESVGDKTKVNVEITIQFGNKLVDKLFGPIIRRRNKTMIDATIATMYEVLASQ